MEGPVESDTGNQIPTMPYASQPHQGNGMAVASMVLGISGFVMMCLFPYVSPICGVLAIVFGFLGLKNCERGASGKGMAIAGLVLGIIGLLLTLLLIVGCLAMFSIGGSVMQEAIEAGLENANFSFETSIPGATEP